LVWVGSSRNIAPPRRTAYHLVPDWPQLSDGIILGQVAGLCVDSNGDVFVFHRAERVWEGEAINSNLIASPTVLVLNGKTGEVIEQWGVKKFVMPHGLTIDKKHNLWLTDVGLHQVLKFDHDGNLLMTLGERGVAGEDFTHFNMPEVIAIAPDGSFYVSDGYGNSRVIKFSEEGNYMTSWGTKDTGSGQFDVAHNIALDSQGRVHFEDRGNARIQIFDEAGQLFKEWKGSLLGRPWVGQTSICSSHC